jgi:uncharacterized protein YkwD
VPRTFGQGAAFVTGFAIALWLSPFGSRISRAEEPSAPQIEAALHAAVNEVRARHRLIPLERAGALDAVARAHSDDMARRQFLAHVTPEGANPLDRLERAGIAGFTLAAENLGKTDRLYAPSQEIVTAWLGSPVHRENLLAPHFNTTGIGVTRASDGSLLVTQLYVTYPR